ncbi:hypothetical protein GBZ26_23365, partial [Azospirillum formosense]
MCRGGGGGDQPARFPPFFVAAGRRRWPGPATPAAGPRPVFIAGAPRSGTTLVEQILSSHPAIAAGDE